MPKELLVRRAQLDKVAETVGIEILEAVSPSLGQIGPPTFRELPPAGKPFA